MEYMSNGSLKDFIDAKNNVISTPQRLQWAREAAEGLQVLHAANIINCDVDPKNLFLNADLSLKIAYFSGSSLNGLSSSACASQRFLLPNFDWRRPPVVQDDLFSLGSLIYFIMTGQYPFQELASDEVEANYKAYRFPNDESVDYRDVIKRCWSLEANSAQDVYLSLQKEDIV